MSKALAKIQETASNLDALAMQAIQISGDENKFTQAIESARIMNEIKSLISDGDFMGQIMPLAGSKIGFKTDRNYNVNEIQDAIITNGIKSPSWPLFYANLTKDVRSGFKLTLDKSRAFLSEASLALDMLDDNYKVKPFLEFLFLTVNHYNEFWFKELISNRSELLISFQKIFEQKKTPSVN